MNVISFYDPQNTWWGTLKRFKRDGNEFRDQAYIGSLWYNNEHCQNGGDTCRMVAIYGINAFDKRQNLFEQIRAISAGSEKYDRINFFCHGHPRALNRKMISMVNIGKFCEHLKSIAAPGCKIVFYSCKTAKLDDGFAATVARLTGYDVIGHTTSGHTTRNPYKRLFMITDGYVESLWRSSGVSALKNKLALKKGDPQSKYAPFEFVESVFSE